MPTTLLAFLLLALGLILPADVRADDHGNDHASGAVAWVPGSADPGTLARAHALHLADSPYWRVLMYYDRAGTGYRSHVSQSTFFLSAAGRSDPAAELDALLESWLAETKPAPDASVRCRFPARITWLREQLGITLADHADAPCPELDTWITAINPDQATLVFPSAYLNNPSSMFGHTLLRIDAPNQTEETRLLAYAVNYAAQTRESNGFLFAIKGLTGGYPGGFSLLPYYQKVKEYNDLENRDLWEYQLTLTPAEVKRLLLHLWEMRRIYFPYYFFSDNCSYELLGLLDSARPGLTLRAQFPHYAIPVDTVRAALAGQGMLKTIVYRPSSATRLQNEIAGNSTAINRTAEALVGDAGADTSALPLPEQARATETAYDVLYYRFLAREVPQASTPRQLRSLLLKRSSLEAPDQRTPPPRPALDPAHGHATARSSISTGVDGSHGFVGADIRPAYHDLLDAPGGYVNGARIDFLDTGLRYLPETTQLQIDHFTLVAIDSLTPRNAFIKPLSWGLAAGQRRVPLDADGRFDPRQRRAVAYGEGETGISLNAGETLCFVQAKAEVEAAPVIRSGWRTGLGPRLGCLGQAGAASQWLATAQLLHRDDSEVWEPSLALGWQHQDRQGNALRLDARLLAQHSQSSGGVELAWLHYF